VCATLVVVCALIAGVTCVGCNSGAAFLCRKSILARYTCIFSVTDVRQQFTEIGATFWIENAWTPKLQRNGDLSLMEHFLRISLTKRERRDLSACLKWLRVITLADLADKQGLDFPAGRLTGECRAESSYEWPLTSHARPREHGLPSAEPDAKNYGLRLVRGSEPTKR
jgi:hypothetical protein